MQVTFLDPAFSTDPNDEAAEVGDPRGFASQRLKAIAAQHLVAADILCRGYGCSIAAESLRYDLIADIGGLRRVQVKMTLGLQMASGKYMRYRFWGGNHNSKLRDYQGDIDLFAFVAMDLGRIKYALPEHVDLVAAAFRPSEFDADRCELAWQEVLRAWSDRPV